VWDDTGFKVGLIAMIINPTSGPSGTDVALTAIGFADGPYNMSFGADEDYLTGTVVAEAIADNFFVPTIETGVYDVSVTDSNENVLTTTFTVTATTSLTATPMNVALGYNMSFYGENYANDAGATLEWYIWNSTWEDEIFPEFEDSPVTVSADGNFTGYWIAPEDDLILGNTYCVNATDEHGLWAEICEITVVEEEIEIWPNSPSYSLGEVITFTIKATFEKNSELEIMDPDGELVFFSTFAMADWEPSGTWKVIRYWDQVIDDVKNPYLIPSDAQIGTWNWTLTDTDEDEVVASGQITVLPTTAEQVDQRLSLVEGSLADLADDIAGVTSELEDEIGDLASDIADVASEVDNLRDEIVSDLADDIAAAADAADAATEAVGDLEDAVSDIADVATDAKSAADSAKTAADAAKTSADEAKTAATGLTTLVYGAIAASLIAALAAIVSLMQISRKIA
jgi:tetrahydromethanopterin S-methyltransferase subunit B